MPLKEAVLERKQDLRLATSKDHIRSARTCEVWH